MNYQCFVVNVESYLSSASIRAYISSSLSEGPVPIKLNSLSCKCISSL